MEADGIQLLRRVEGEEQAGAVTETEKKETDDLSRRVIVVRSLEHLLRVRLRPRSPSLSIFRSSHAFTSRNRIRFLSRSAEVMREKTVIRIMYIVYYIYICIKRARHQALGITYIHLRGLGNSCSWTRRIILDFQSVPS